MKAEIMRTGRPSIDRDPGALVLRALALAAVLLAHSAAARAQVGDSLARAATDSMLTAPAVPGDSARSDSTAPATPPPQTPSPAAVSVPIPPTDTTLARACAGAAPGTLAPGLLAVVFRPGTTDKDRAGAARAVGGTVGGLTDMGEVYVRVPPAAGPLHLVADQLIRQDPVTRVTPVPCPAPTPTPPASGAPAQNPPAQAAPTPGAPSPVAPSPGAPAPPDTSAARAGESAAAAPRPAGP
jgi:hypothetical protein